MRKPYFDIKHSEGGESKTYYEMLSGKKPNNRIISPSKPSSFESDIELLIQRNESHRALTNENIELAHKIATMEIEHQHTKWNYLIIGIFSGMVIWELFGLLIKLIVG